MDQSTVDRHADEFGDQPHVLVSNRSDGCDHVWHMRWMDAAGAVLACANCPAVATWTQRQIATLITKATANINP